MGSLLPGWDERAPGVAPKELQDFNEEEEEQLGYFAAYNKMKKQQKEQGTSYPLLRRNSMPLGRRSNPIDAPTSPLGPRSFEKSATFSPRSLESSATFRAPPQLQRLTSMPVTAGERFDMIGMTPKTPKIPTHYGGSDSPLSPSLEAYKTYHEPKQEMQWWRNFDSAHLNEMPDVPVSKERGYIPQYKAAGQKIHYRVDEGNSEGALLEGVDISGSPGAGVYV